MPLPLLRTLPGPRSPLLHFPAVSLLLACDPVALADARAADLPAPSAAFAPLVAEHAYAGRYHEAIDAFSRMPDLDRRLTAFVYHAVFKVLVYSGVILLALALYNRMVAAGCPPTQGHVQCAMDGLCKRGMAGDALKVFDEMLERGIAPNVKIYTVLLSSSCNAGRIEDATRLLGSMKEKSAHPMRSHTTLS